MHVQRISEIFLDNPLKTIRNKSLFAQREIREVNCLFVFWLCNFCSISVHWSEIHIILSSGKHIIVKKILRFLYMFFKFGQNFGMIRDVTEEYFHLVTHRGEDQLCVYADGDVLSAWSLWCWWTFVFTNNNIMKYPLVHLIYSEQIGFW